MADLVTLARDEQERARLVVLRQFSPYLQEDRYSAYVATGDLLWAVGCSHSHKTEDVAGKCARGLVRRTWKRRRKAAEVVLVESGRVVEWRWPFGNSGAEYARCAPVHQPDDATLVEYGRV